MKDKKFQLPDRIDTSIYDKKVIVALKEKLSKILKESRYEHSIGVAYTAASMAMAFGYEPYKAVLAGILHDCAKPYDLEESLQYGKKYGVSFTPYEIQHPALIHAKLGAAMVPDLYHVYDQEILDAIRTHTTGEKAMTDLQKIIYAADYLEPGRKPLPNFKRIRQLAFSDLDACVYEIMRDVNEYLLQTGQEVEQETLEVMEYYRKVVESR